MLFRPVHFFRLCLVTLFLVMGISAGQASPFPSANGDQPVNFTAKSLTHDDKRQTVTAIGDVELVQDTQILRADKMVYYLAEDKVTALGNVSLLDAEGNVHFAEYVELRNKMKDGFVQGILTLLADGSRFTAVEAKRENNGTKTTLTEATYTLCKVCEADPHPLWQIKADRVTHDTTLKTVKYKHARLELLGVPLAYSPIFSHPDPTLKRKSGFLRPQYGWTTGLGTNIEGGYYFDIAPNRDLTLKVKPTSLAGTLVDGEWRERFVSGAMKFNVSTVRSDRKEEDGTTSTGRQRGHIFADGRFDLNENWRSGFAIARASDKQYLRLYDISKENVLSTQVYTERFAGRDYSKISAINFQDVRLGIRPQQPDILPMMEHKMTGEPGAFAGGRWQAGISALGLTRTNDLQDVQRGTLDLGWERRDVTAGGISTVLKLDGQGDYYGVQNSDAARLDPTLESDTTIGRGKATASLTASYPLVKPNASSQTILEPMAGVSFSPNTQGRNDEIPNEDSIDIQFDSSNLFQQNRFPGVDRQEDGGRINYGLTSGLYANDGKYGKTFIGQSYRFSGDNIYPDGSGLEDRVSDVVGQVKVGLSKYLDADYRFQLDNRTLAARRHEVQAGGGSDDLRLNTRYIYTGEVIGTGFTEPRQQLMVDGTYNLTRTWKFQASSLVDLGDEPGLRNAASGITYADECFTFSVVGSRNVANEVSGENETKVLLRLGFKSIGEFSSPQIQLGQKQAK